jgi:hypothetical protein
MLRRPSFYLRKLREEGCSSTAFDSADYSATAVGNNLTVRGSAVAE